MRMASIEMEDPSENRISPVLFPFIVADAKKNHGNDTYIRRGPTRDPAARAFILCIRPFSRSSCSVDHPPIREIDTEFDGESSPYLLTIPVLPGIEGLPNYIRVYIALTIINRLKEPVFLHFFPYLRTPSSFSIVDKRPREIRISIPRRGSGGNRFP